MNRNRSARMSLAALGAVAALAGAFWAGKVAADQPHMEKAIDHLQSARRELNDATPDKGGHRERALKLVDDAIAETRKGMRFDRRH